MLIINIDKYKYFGCGIGFCGHESYSRPSGENGRNVKIFGVDMSSYSKIDNWYVSMYSINFTENNKKLCLSSHYNGANSYLFVNGTEIQKFEAKDSEIAATPLCLGNNSKDWSVDNMKETGLNRYVYDFSVDYDATAVDDILDINKYLMKKNNMI